MHRLALVSLLLLTGCVSSRVEFTTRPSDVSMPASEIQAGQALFPMVEAGQWGYMDRTGQVVISPLYDFASDFSEGLAAVRVGNEWGYIAPDSRWVVRPQYTQASAYSDGRARVAVGTGADRRFGYLDVAGQEVVETALPFALDYTEGLALVRLTEDRRTAFQRFLVRVGALDEASGLVFLTTDGTVAFEVPGESAASFAGGRAPFERDRGWFRSSAWGYVDATGTIVVAPTLDGPAFRYSDGLARVGREGRMGFVNREGTFVIEPVYPLALPFSDGRAAVQDEDGRWGFIDATGAEVVPPRFRAARSFTSGLAAVQTETGWGYIDATGTLVVDATYTTAEPFRNGLARVYENRLLRYIDTDGSTVWAQP
ncbi:MAG: WG repeat-containing protein [Bacteroidota bacterium]